MRKRHMLTIVAFWLLSIIASAQETSPRDTLQAAVKIDHHQFDRSLGHLKTGTDGIRSAASPLGEGDPVRWVQGMPGVATGADGTTSMYVRGGNVGNNLVTLDGVPIYGYSHILGLTTIVPTDITESVTLSKGGFYGNENNFTSAHLNISSKEPSDVKKTQISANNFLASASVECPITKSLSFLASLRLSPVGMEYKAVKKMLPPIVGAMENFHAEVGDVFTKLHYNLDGGKSLDASFLGSMDSYDFNSSDDSYELMRWNNMIGQIRFRREGLHTTAEMTFSGNRYDSRQQQDKIYRGTENHLSLSSLLREYALKASMRHRLGNGRAVLSDGFEMRSAGFAPGQIGEQTRTTRSTLLTGWIQAEYNIHEHLSVRGMGRANSFRNYDMLQSEDRMNSHLEYGLSAKWHLADGVTLEASYDDIVQYYHTLEGLPVGWSLDMIVPSGKSVLPEYARQGSIGLSKCSDSNEVSLELFNKRMENLIYYKYSQALFSEALAAWEEHIELGNGLSYGIEALYEYKKKDLYARLSYTLSKNTREGFPSFYNGETFHARFDRRHVINAIARWRNLSATLMFQSGNWENGEAETYKMPYLDNSTWIANYFSGVNNYHLSPILRLDISYHFEFSTGNLEHSLNIGVCNVTNHFNPFMIFFDTRAEVWNAIALLPILPTFSWRINI